MNTLIKIIFLNTVLGLSMLAHAGTQILTEITVSGESYILNLVLDVDEKKDIKKFKLIEYNKGKEVAVAVHETSGVSDGIVLMKVSGREVVKLQSDNFTEYQGGEIKLDFLYSGISGKRKKMILDVSRDGDVWALTAKGKSADKLHFVKNKKMIVGVIGVKRIEIR
jgi:hypothetical protein